MYISKRSVDRYGLNDCIFTEFLVDEHDPVKGPPASATSKYSESMGVGDRVHNRSKAVEERGGDVSMGSAPVQSSREPHSSAALSEESAEEEEEDEGGEEEENEFEDDQSEFDDDEEEEEEEEEEGEEEGLVGLCPAGEDEGREGGAVLANEAVLLPASRKRSTKLTVLEGCCRVRGWGRCRGS
jgi:hypothetical protein